MKKKCNAANIISIISVIIVIVLSIYNIYKKNDVFFKCSFYELLILLSGIYVGVSYVETHSKKEKQFEKYGRLLDKFETNLISGDEIKKLIKSNNNEKILLSFKRMNNILYLLEEYSQKLNLKKEINELKIYYTDYNDKLSSHINSADKIDFNELERIKANIENKIDDIRMKLS